MEPGTITPNPETGEVTVAVRRNGETKEYTLKLTMKAAIQLQQRRKKTLGEIVQACAAVDADYLCDVLFVLLQPHHKDEFKTVDQAGELLDDMRLLVFVAAFNKLMDAGGVENNPANPPTAAAIPTGDGSTSTAAA